MYIHYVCYIYIYIYIYVCHVDANTAACHFTGGRPHAVALSTPRQKVWNGVGNGGLRWGMGQLWRMAAPL